MTRRIVSVSALLLTIIGCQKTKESIAPPLAPSALTATAISTSQIDLSWTDNSTSEDGFRIERKTGAEAYKEIATINKDVTTYQDKGLIKANSYTYRVYAYNNGGKSPSYTNEATAMTLDDIPAAATNLTATAIGYNQISLAWEDKASNETGYQVERRSGTDAYSPLVKLAANSTAFKDSTAAENTEYTYRVFPFNASVNGDYSNEAKAKTPLDIISGLVAYYPFSGNAGDSSGNGNHGTVNGAVLSADRFGIANSAYEFNGMNNYISVALSNSLKIQKSFSSSVWILMSGGGCNPRIYELHDQIDCGGYNLNTVGASNTSRVIDGNFGVCNGSITTLSNSGVNLSALTWHHVSYTVDGVTGQGKLYIDGNLAYTVKGNPIGTITYYGGALIIGNINPNRCDWWGGKIDDLRLYNRILTQDQVAYLATH